MRIRKHAKLSNLMFSHASSSGSPPETIQTHVCQLNQSPWDVITFPPDSSLWYPPENQVEGDDAVTANGSLEDSIGAAESLASLKTYQQEVKEEDMKEDDVPMLVSSETVVDDEGKKENQAGLKIKGEMMISCNKSDGKGWQCRREAKEGNSLCEHHLAQLRSYHSVSQSSNRKSEKPAEKVVGIRRRGRKKKASSTSNPSEFYYYSGFGPLWGKKRGAGGESNKTDQTKAVEPAPETTPSPSSQIDNIEEFDLVDDDDDDDNDDIAGGSGNTGKKRARKPVKARSLKSLM